jgi:RNase P subunit RPR2
VVLAVTFLGGWALLIGANLLAARRYRVQISRYGLACPACYAPLVQYLEPRSGRKRADVVLASGRCPDCGARVFAPDA